MIKRPTKITIAAWFAILIGIGAFAGGGGLLLLRTAGKGEINLSTDYQTFIQIIFGIFMIYGGMESLFRKPLAQNILIIGFSIVLIMVLSFAWKESVVSDKNLNQKIMAFFGNLTILAPTVFCIFVLRSKEAKSFFENKKT